MEANHGYWWVGGGGVGGGIWEWVLKHVIEMQVHTTVKNLLKSDLENQAGRTYDTKSKVMISTLSIAVHWICLGMTAI
ncbi:hypothetical protein C5167_023425 [Papaver somniferum]|uniref:Uncharacterized protein n=1 Tax=Papaver somniferum TaxID=3469 RepID=A0A4Y7JKM8_PAPSO|nr:hypothetical protein C5167_023425 [Papaver somniferum]